MAVSWIGASEGVPGEAGREGVGLAVDFSVRWSGHWQGMANRTPVEGVNTVALQALQGSVLHTVRALRPAFIAFDMSSLAVHTPSSALGVSLTHHHWCGCSTIIVVVGKKGRNKRRIRRIRGAPVGPTRIELSTAPSTKNHSRQEDDIVKTSMAERHPILLLAIRQTRWLGTRLGIAFLSTPYNPH